MWPSAADLLVLGLVLGRSMISAPLRRDLLGPRAALAIIVLALAKQLTTLEEVGYVEISKTFVGKRARTSARLTSVGRAAFDQHVAALQEIVAKAGMSVRPEPGRR
jgi:hypothetical protein